jgi:uncharacterized protein YdaU (DUF1376 family)
MSPQQILAAVGLVVCVLMLAHMALGERRRARLDASLRRAALRLRLAWAQRRLKKQRSAHAESDAREEAERVIEQARRSAAERNRAGAKRDGNIVRPERFGRRRNDMH